jgi:TatD DNase family protein
MGLTDTHCHLQDPRLAADLPAVLDRARAAGVATFVCCATSEADWEAVLALAAGQAGILPFLGLHPWHVEAARAGWEDRLGAALEASGAGVGECGLDFALEAFDRTAQEAAFRSQLRLARDLDRPLSVHCRRAWERLEALTREEGLPPSGGVIHAFSGSAETARVLQALGFHLGFGCSLTNPEARRAREAVLGVALDRLLLETDSPDLGPRHLPGWADRPNEPANLVRVLEAAAALRGEAPEGLAAQVQANAIQVFGRHRIK